MGQQVSEIHRYTSSKSSKLDLSNEKLDRRTKQLESVEQLQQTALDEVRAVKKISGRTAKTAKKVKLLTRPLVEVLAETVALAKQIHQDYANDSTKKLSNIEHTIKNTETKATIRHQQNIRFYHCRI
ncbi:hypothetical protein BU25DRAFT_453858 [Macroventuria anomochaeta]|uniref:Uncharacterized protein n=1 Tax=Macroventuria anomochaeta TaxID=301207 RepID=A0ACB6SF99_9PLEO|nr:uncharacterized protein BU25DRAFT_453858 [Macroventuria anomochaeta]KAF2632657.1 hypothetical protein BU25DRAFT_453858 [Macroventuria anomochaeta]